MAGVKNAMEIFTILDKSNCRLCGEKTCLAFAGAVFLGRKKLSECPKVEPETVQNFSTPDTDDTSDVDIQEEYLSSLTQKATQLDFDNAAKRVRAVTNGGVLSFNVLGKRFGLNKEGKYLTDLHIIPWVIMPLLDYVCHCQGLKISGDWISFREIPGGREKYGLFKKRGEDVLRVLGDRYSDFFDDIVHMFEGQDVAKQFESDISVVLHPFPLVPVMICYWKAEDGMESKLNLFFDSSVTANLGLESAFFIGTGIAQMFEKMADHHAF